METIDNVKQSTTYTNNNQIVFSDLLRDEVISNPFVNSKVNFEGENNLLLIDSNVQVSNSIINFKGSNSLIYIRKTRNNKLSISCSIYNESTLFINQGSSVNGRLNLVISESQNILIGRDCMFSFGCWLRTADVHLIYDSNTKNRINFSKGLIIGDHVWIGQDSKLLKGAKIGSGSVVGLGTVVSNAVPSNSIVAGVPAKIVKLDIFWDRQSSHFFTSDEGRKHDSYKKKSSSFEFGKDSNEQVWLAFSEQLSAIKKVTNKVEAIDEFDKNTRPLVIEALVKKNRLFSRFKKNN